MKQSRFLSILHRWTPVFLWCGLIFFFSSLPQLPLAPKTWQDFLIKKTAHMVEFGVLYLLVFRAFRFSSSRKNFWLSLLFTCFYALSDEYHQRFVPGRHPSLRDVGFDTLGALLASRLPFPLTKKS